jgi:hypothetical protein
VDIVGSIVSQIVVAKIQRITKRPKYCEDVMKSFSKHDTAVAFSLGHEFSQSRLPLVQSYGLYLALWNAPILKIPSARVLNNMSWLQFPSTKRWQTVTSFERINLGRPDIVTSTVAELRADAEQVEQGGNRRHTGAIPTVVEVNNSFSVAPSARRKPRHRPARHHRPAKSRYPLAQTMLSPRMTTERPA